MPAPASVRRAQSNHPTATGLCHTESPAHYALRRALQQPSGRIWLPRRLRRHPSDEDVLAIPTMQIPSSPLKSTRCTRCWLSLPVGLLVVRPQLFVGTAAAWIAEATAPTARLPAETSVGMRSALLPTASWGLLLRPWAATSARISLASPRPC